MNIIQIYLNNIYAIYQKFSDLPRLMLSRHWCLKDSAMWSTHKSSYTSNYLIVNCQKGQVSLPCTAMARSHKLSMIRWWSRAYPETNLSDNADQPKENIYMCKRHRVFISRISRSATLLDSDAFSTLWMELATSANHALHLWGLERTERMI